MADDPAAQTPTGDSGNVPWLLMVVRAWSQEGRLVVRMTMSGNGRSEVVCYEPSSVAAGDRLKSWLDELCTQRPTDRLERNGAADGPETF